MSFWDTPDGRRALEARAMDRVPLHEAMRGQDAMTATEYDRHMAEVLAAGGAHECASDCPPPPSRGDAMTATEPRTTHRNAAGVEFVTVSCPACKFTHAHPIEAEASGAADVEAVRLDADLLAQAMVTAFRDEARENWPFLRGSGWPAYEEHGHPSQTLVVGLISKRVAAEYARLSSSEAGDGERGQDS